MTIWKIEDRSKSLYKSIADIIESSLAKGDIIPGDQLPTHRDLADILEVNVSTVTKGYKEAEKRGLITGTTGRGTFISLDAGVDIFMQNPGSIGKPLAELGLITPHFGIEPDIVKSLQKLSKTKELTEFMNYTNPSGLPEHKAAGALWAKRYGMDAKTNDVIVCGGAQHALNCILANCFENGDRIAVSNLTYPGMKSLSKMLGISLTGITMDREGMVAKDLEVACKREKIKGVYLMPSVQNPTTRCMSQKRREEIAEVVKKYELILIEDDAYALTLTKVPTPISQIIPDQSIFIAGISKVLGAGLRIAFAVIHNSKLRQAFSRAVLNTLWMAPPLNSALIASWIFDGTAEKVLQLKRKEAKKRYEIAQIVLSGYKIEGSPTGFYIWLELPKNYTGVSFEENAKNMGLNVFCSERFITGDTNVPPAIRVALTCGKDNKVLDKHLRTLRKVLEGEESENVVF